MTSTENSEEVLITEEVVWVELPAAPTKEKRRHRVATPPAPHPSVQDLVKQLIEDGKSYLLAQAEVAKIKGTEAAKAFSGGAILLVMAALFALNLLWWTFHTVEMALLEAVAPWLASLITWGILLVLIIIFGAVGGLLLKKAKEEAPNPAAILKADAEAVKEGLEK